MEMYKESEIERTLQLLRNTLQKISLSPEKIERMLENCKETILNQQKKNLLRQEIIQLNDLIEKINLE